MSDMLEVALRVAKLGSQVIMGPEVDRSVVSIGSVLWDAFTAAERPYLVSRISGESPIHMTPDDAHRYWQYVEGYRQRLLNLLSACRPFGWTTEIQPVWRSGSHLRVVDLVRSAGAYLPTDWLSLYSRTPLDGRSTNMESHCDHYTGRIGISRQWGGITAALHVMTCFVEFNHPQLWTVVDRYYRRRQVDGSLPSQQWTVLQAPNPGPAHAILAWGIEELFFNPWMIRNDEEAQLFLLGLLATA